jgi:hypothetical protein
MIRKYLVVGIILLFVGVTIAPTINFQVVKASSDDDLVEVTTQACGIQGYGNTTVKLTREEYQDLEQYLVEFRARLNQTTTRGEVVPIFKDAVVELDKYGLLPRGMSVEKAQKLIRKEYKIFQDENLLNKLCNKDKRMSTYNSNVLCYLTGQTGNTGVIPFRLRLILFPFMGFFSLLLEYFSGHPIILKICEILENFIFAIFAFSPIGFNEWITFGYLSSWPYGDFYPANGWIYTSGRYGVESWNQSFYGNLGFPILCFGAIDFTGLSLYLPKNERFYLGTALYVEINNY